MLSTALLAAWSCTSHLPPPPPVADAFGPPWAAERAVVLTHINAARRDAGLPPFVNCALLERVGDLHCQTQIREGSHGHFARDGVPPYLRYFLAGGTGFHRENMASHSSSFDVTPAELPGILHEALRRMLAEVPPADGHRRTLLDAEATRIGIGLAVDGGEVRMAHEVAVEGCEELVPPPAVSLPGATLGVRGRVLSPWRLAQVQVLSEPLPSPMTVVEADSIAAYRYPPVRVSFGTGVGGLARDRHGAPYLLELGPGDAFSFSWLTGPSEGIEVVVLLAQRNAADRILTAIAACATVVTRDGVLPSSLDRWRSLRITSLHSL